MNAVRITGAADAVEVAAVLALLVRDGRAPEVSAYDRWRAQRLKALKRGRASRAR